MMHKAMTLMAVTLLAAAPALGAGVEARDLISAVPRPVVSEVVAPQSGLPSAWVGTVAAPREIDLGFPRIGTVAERLARLGDVVQQGQVLARQDPAELDAAVRSARAGVRVAEVQLKTARDALERAVELVDRGVDSATTVETRRNIFSGAEARLEQARATLAQAEDARKYADLTAPQDGVITAVLAEAGATLSAGEALYSLASTGQREVIVDLSEADAAAMAIGTPFHITLEVNPVITAEAKLTSLDAMATRSTRTRRAHLTMEDTAPDAFRLGALVVAKLSSTTGSVITLPVSALIDGSDPAAVWVVSQDTRTLSRVQVATGPRAGGRVVILNGLSAGDEVLTKGVNSVENGQTVGERDAQ